MSGIRYLMNEKIEIKRCENRIHAYKSHFHNEISIGFVENGFYDQSHFTKYFKEYTGVTPMEYRS